MLYHWAIPSSYLEARFYVGDLACLESCSQALNLNSCFRLLSNLNYRSELPGSVERFITSWALQKNPLAVRLLTSYNSKTLPVLWLLGELWPQSPGRLLSVCAFPSSTPFKTTIFLSWVWPRTPSLIFPGGWGKNRDPDFNETGNGTFQRWEDWVNFFWINSDEWE